jgi:hypothetical protein
VGQDPAPLLGGTEADAPALGALHAGDLVTVVRGARPSLAWRGTLAGQPLSAEGELVEVQRSPADDAGYLFRGALDGEVRAPAAAYVCRRVGGGPDCPARLRRVDAGDAGTLAFVPCFGASCPIALVRGRKLSVLTVDGLTDARVGTLNGQRVAFVDALVTSGPQSARGALHVLRVGDTLERALLINTLEKDIAGPRHHLIEGRLEIAPDRIRYVGVERFIDDVHKAELSARPLEQSYRLATPARAPSAGR